MAGLLQVGQLPPRKRSTGRKRGKWRGHEQIARELRVLAARESDPDRRWGKVEERVSSTKSQSIAGAIKKGQAIGFEQTNEGHYEATCYQSPDQSKAPTDSDGPKILYDVWARWVPRR